MLPTQALAAINRDEITKFASLFGSMKLLRKKLSPDDIDESALDRTFEAHVAAVLERLESRLTAVSGLEFDSDILARTEVTMARHGLLDAAMQQAIYLSASISPGFGEALRDIRMMHSAYLTELDKNVTDLSSKLNDARSETAEARRSVHALENECGTLMQAADLLDAVIMP